MKTPLRILQLEDSPQDAELVQAVLAKDGLACAFDVADNRERFLTLLEKGGFDLIVSDYSMPQFNGLEALKLVAEHAPATPFIFVSGTLGEERAVEALKSGATDYVMKDRLGKLGLVVRRALAEVEARAQARRDEAELRHSAADLARAQRIAHLGSWESDPATGAVVLSEEMYRLLGREPGQFTPTRDTLLECVHPDDRRRVDAAFQEAIQCCAPFTLEHRFVRPDGVVREVVLTAECVSAGDDRGFLIAGVTQDVTEHKSLERQLLRAQRLESIGTLAAGVAHDLNNALMPALMCADVLRDIVGDNAKGRQMLELMENSVRAGTGIVKQVLAFARGMEGERTLLQPKHLLRDMETIARQTFPKNIRLVLDYTRDLWVVHADATQLQQVLMNLCINARDAMPEGGTLALAVANVQVDEQFARMHPDSKAGPYVVLTVADTGTGIPADIQTHIFDPFFTTKALGKGTGLGLSTAHGIVKNHGGFIALHSEAGKGAEFKVYLPAVATEETGPAAVAAEPPRGAGEWVLVAEDTDATRVSLIATLVEYGYRTVSAADGAEAVAAFATRKDEIAAVVMDLEMPVMTGVAALRALRRIKPDVKLIAISGLPPSPAFTAEYAAIPFLAKPFGRGELLTTLHSLLHAAAGACASS